MSYQPLDDFAEAMLGVIDTSTVEQFPFNKPGHLELRTIDSEWHVTIERKHRR